MNWSSVPGHCRAKLDSQPRATNKSTESSARYATVVQITGQNQYRGLKEKAQKVGLF